MGNKSVVVSQDGNQTRAAERLQITRRSLKLKMDRYGIAAT